jgi:hypothetical protein
MLKIYIYIQYGTMLIIRSPRELCNFTKDWFNPSCIRMNIWGVGVVEFENLIIFSN